MFQDLDRAYLAMRLNRIEAKLDQLLGIEQKETGQMVDLKKAVDDLVTKVSDQKTVIDGAVATINELKAQIGQVAGDLDAAGEAEAAQKLNDLVAAIDANTMPLALAIAKNTGANDEVHSAQM